MYNKRAHISLIILVLVLMYLVTTMSNAAEVNSNEHIKILVTSSTLAEIVKVLGNASLIKVINIIPPTVDPHIYEPSLRDLIKAVSEADLIVTSGPHHLPIEESIFRLKSEGLIKTKILGFDDYVAHGLKPLTIDSKLINYHGFFFSLSGMKAVIEACINSLSELNISNLNIMKEKSEVYLNYLEKIYDYVRRRASKYEVILYSPILQYLMHDLNIKVIRILTPEVGVEIPLKELSKVLEMYQEGYYDFIILTDIDLEHSSKILSYLRENDIPYVIVEVKGKSPEDVLLNLLTSLIEISNLTEKSKPEKTGEFVGERLILWLSITVNVVLASILLITIIKVKIKPER